MKPRPISSQIRRISHSHGTDIQYTTTVVLNLSNPGTLSLKTQAWGPKSYLILT